jgi:predicted GIY-YIG superfamily endonuclease
MTRFMSAWPTACRGSLKNIAMAETRDSRRYGVRRLVHAEQFADPAEAIAQEKRVKRWWRDGKVALIERANPDWNDLYPTTQLD